MASTVGLIFTTKEVGFVLVLGLTEIWGTYIVGVMFCLRTM